MQSLKIEATEDTPEVVLDNENAVYSIKGRSLPEDVTSFYTPVLNWLDAFGESPKPATTFTFNLEYFNTASSKMILDVLMKLEEIHADRKSEISIDWYYLESDSDMLEAGEEFKDLIEVPFNFHKC